MERDIDAPVPAAAPLREELFEALAEAFALHRAQERAGRDEAMAAMRRELTAAREQIAELCGKLDAAITLLAGCGNGGPPSLSAVEIPSLMPGRRAHGA